VIQPDRLLPLRHRFVRAVRAFFDAAGFIEVETPLAVASPGMEPHLSAFEVASGQTPPSHRRLYLHTSPEYHMKRVLARHRAPIFQLCRCFRDEPASRLHHPEFTMLEWYRPDADYFALMDDCDALLAHLAVTLLGGAPLALPEGPVDLSSGCERLTVSEAFRRHAGFDPLALPELETLRAACGASGLTVPEHWSWEDAFHFALLERVEPRLGRGRPTLLRDYPRCLAALSRIVGDHAERFELYVAGHELANAFSELVDASEQRARFQAEQREREALGRPVYPLDEALLDALHQLPPTAGIALGLDRLFLLFAEHHLGRRLALTDALWLAL
jgi:elongation factor P--(R)-beta-lysine ligase